MQVLSTNWTEAWLVTGYGIGTVFAILVLLVFVLVLFNKVASGSEKPAAAAPTPKPAQKLASEPAVSISEAMGHDEVAIAVALYMYLNDMHDYESGVLTINHNEDYSGWHFQLGN